MIKKAQIKKETCTEHKETAITSCLGYLLLVLL